MKKLFLTTITACVGLFASAQFSMVSSINMLGSNGVVGLMALVILYGLLDKK